MEPWEDSSAFQLGTVYYVKRPALTVDNGLPLQKGPFVIVRLKDGNVPEPQSLREHVDHLLALDDVLSQSYLSGIVILTKHSTRSLILPEADGPWSDLCRRWGTQWIKIVGDDSATAQGPYLADVGGIHQVWRVYDDLNNAFVLSIWSARHVKGQEPSFENTRLAGNAPRCLGIAVPSRLYFEPSDEKPLNGLRFAVKDSIHLNGVITSCCSRAYSRLYPPSKTTCSSVLKLISLGAQVVGKVHLSALIMKEEPPEAVDYSSPFNPRGDGYQTPAGSSSGSASAIAAYKWLDFSVGTDTTGSTRRPALWNGVYSIRPSIAMLAQDGFVPTMLEWDTLSLFTRDVRLLGLLTAKWYSRPCITPSPDHVETVLLYPTDFCHLENAAQMHILNGFLAQLTSSMGVHVKRINVHEEWAKSAPVSERNLTTYLQNVIEKTFYYDATEHFTTFRADFQAAFGQSRPFVSPITRLRWSIAAVITEEQRDQALERLRVFKKWFLGNILLSHGRDAYVILPIEDLKPTYRDELPLPPTEFPQGIDHLTLCPALGAVEVTVPAGQVRFTSRITKQEEYLPVMVSLMGAPESDHKLVAWIEDFMRRSHKLPYVTTGKTMYEREEGSLYLEKILESTGSLCSAPKDLPDCYRALAAQTPYYNVPAVSDHVQYLERQCISSKLDVLITRKNSHGRKIVLEGLGGLGKTTIAKQFAHRARSAFDVIVWLPCGDTTAFNEAIVTIVQALGLNVDDHRLTYASSRRLLEEWLSYPRQHGTGELAHWLLILDNLVDVSFLGKLCSLQSFGSTLITCRDITVVGLPPVDRGRRVEVRPFESRMAADILSTLISPQQSRKLGADVATIVTSQALSVRLLRGMISHPVDSSLDTLTRFESSSTLLEWGHTDCLIFRAAFTRLSSFAQSVLRVVSLLSYTDLTRGILHAVINAVARVAPEVVIEELLRAGLIEVQAPDCFGMHHLIADEILDAMPACLDHFNVAAAVLYIKWPFDRVRNELLYTNECGVLITHILTLHTHYVKNAAALGPQRAFISLVACAGCYMMERGNLIAAADLCEQCYALNSKSWQTIRTLQSANQSYKQDT